MGPYIAFLPSPLRADQCPRMAEWPNPDLPGIRYLNELRPIDGRPIDGMAEYDVRYFP